ncbi:uncharacterized protein LOC111816137 isoform X2 [Octodon degus]|uniref:Uncharacterized protein LOC111816137 isoform X2 n=1 Tax=Octodon degus TaxID=10160 RepID=A0A6P6E871_OCTDE|nr:uncharacterized protein LOC111816137 isoform X2 [Octodon degus]
MAAGASSGCGSLGPARGRTRPEPRGARMAGRPLWAAPLSQGAEERPPGAGPGTDAGSQRAGRWKAVRVLQEVRGVRRHSRDPAAPGSPGTVPLPRRLRDSGSGFLCYLPSQCLCVGPTHKQRIQPVSATDLAAWGPWSRWTARGPALVSRTTKPLLVPPGRRTRLCSCVSSGSSPHPPGDFQIRGVAQWVGGKPKMTPDCKVPQPWTSAWKQLMPSTGTSLGSPS